MKASIFLRSTLFLTLSLAILTVSAQDPRIGTSVGDLAPELTLQGLDGEEV